MKINIPVLLTVACAVPLWACDLQSRIVSAVGGNGEQSLAAPSPQGKGGSDLYGADADELYGTDVGADIIRPQSSDLYGSPTMEYVDKNDYAMPTPVPPSLRGGDREAVGGELSSKTANSPPQSASPTAPPKGEGTSPNPSSADTPLQGRGELTKVDEPTTPAPKAEEPPAPVPPKDEISVLTSGNSEPDDVLLVPAKVARADKKVEIIAPPVGEIIVEKGDTVYGLSKKHNVPLRDFLDANDIKPPYAISPGQRLRLPSARVHTVVAGDTLYSISRAYSVDLNSLAAENNIAAPYGLAVGQKLRLPASTTQSVVQSTDNRDQRSDKDAAAKKTEDAAKKELEKLQAEKNKIEQEKKNLEAEKKKIEAEKQRAETEKQKAEVEKKKQEAEKKKAELDKQAKAAEAKITEQKQKITSTPTSKLPAATARAGSKFAWPVQGKIISDFGAKKNGLYNDGINIGAKLGTVVRAAENGVVAYAGNELKGMGNLVIIQHSGGWMTVYAHMDTMVVKRGAKVSVGEKIGTVGQTGKVSEPQLHFEIRNGTKAYNPRTQLK